MSYTEYVWNFVRQRLQLMHLDFRLERSNMEFLPQKTQASEGVTKITSAKQRSAIHDKMERLLLVWINEQEMKQDVTSMPIIQEKAREIFEKLKEQTPGSSSEE
ncbi:tigger transposable element-derived protein 1-like protein [Trichonephila clavipes]|nr:tigger transposable element-derived protein 1-like protein [Trichonephila clavipes]